MPYQHPGVARSGNVVEDQLVSAFLGVPLRQGNDVSNDLVVSKPHALHDLAVANVETGNDAAGERRHLALPAAAKCGAIFIAAPDLERISTRA